MDWQVYEGEADEEMEGDSKDSTEGAMEPNPPIETAEIDQKPSAAPTLDTASDLSSSHKKCVVQGTFKSKESARRFLGHRWLPSTVQVVVTPIATEHGGSCLPDNKYWDRNGAV